MMEYTIKQLAQLANITTRTLRYYDEIGLLKPLKVNDSGYRIYGEHEVNQLQQILFYRELGFSLEKIKEILTHPSFDRLHSLKYHYEQLLQKKQQLQLLICNVEKTIAMVEGKTIMTDQEKFLGFKKQLIEENELKYGKEIREKYGEETIDRTNQKVLNMSEETYLSLEKLTEELNKAIKKAFEQGDPSSELAMKACGLHKKWLMHYWDHYSKEAHMGLVQMYVDDVRFTRYYDKIAKGSAKFLRDAMQIYLNQ